MPQATYCYVRVVGRGSYGEVTLVKHRRDGKQYVIKTLNLRNASSRERRAAEQEAQLLSQLKHPNIVTYKESWEGGDGLLYIVMGFCEGGDLYRKLKEQKGQLLPESQVVEWFVQIAMALQYLHEKHILHRDLKTQNVFLTRTNIIKVGDLGIARVLEHHSDMASTLIGTPYYMSPELFSNQPYNYKSDVWALGCCVYEMATLKHAFNAKDMNSLVYRIIEGKGEDKCLSQEKPVAVDPLKSPASLKGHTGKPIMNNTAESFATISRINIDILPAERRNSVNDDIVQDTQPRQSDASDEVDSQFSISQDRKERFRGDTNSSDQPDSLLPRRSSDDCDGEGNDLVVKDQKPDQDQVTGGCMIEKQDSIPPRFQPHSSVSEPSVSGQRRQKKREQTDHDQAKSQSALIVIHIQRVRFDDMLVQSQSSWPWKSHTNEMSDLVQLMTQTLKLDSKESCEDLPVLNPVPEFRLHGKYRDTLVLHGKVAEDAELHCKELPSAVIPGSEKIRRIVEVLRADVIQGLGIHLLEQVYDLLDEEEDELEREARLREHMGDKYTTYSVKARQLKFFEENVNF
ncbi:Serine/threonine-protein kinase Nek4 [Microtus ochrogaster]|uniref:Serine/threonine-protein kinase Nek4 n=1 Tax=Microtus ochrogaster TaxID=79684 RepID=A0A8J6GT15_MICOH|nr:Serine/threonine-protein kinase Nek4 [Microtus ochrogaster]